MAGLGQFSFPACGLGWAGVEQGSHYRVSSAGGVAALPGLLLSRVPTPPPTQQTLTINHFLIRSGECSDFVELNRAKQAQCRVFFVFSVL